MKQPTRRKKTDIENFINSADADHVTNESLSALKTKKTWGDALKTTKTWGIHEMRRTKNENTPTSWEQTYYKTQKHTNIITVCMFPYVYIYIHIYI